MNQPYETRDWIESSICLSQGLRLMGVRRNGSCYFQFEDRERAVGLLESYWRGDLTINARAFVDAQRRVKDIIHREGKGE